MRRTTLAVALSLALPLTAAAQEGHQHGAQQPPEEAAQDHGMMGGMEMMGGMAMMRHHPGPGMILRLRESLALTEAQVERLESLHAAAHEEMRGHMEAAREARQRAHATMEGDAPDLAAFERALREAADHAIQAQRAMARVHLEAGQVLEPGQRERLRTVTAAMEELQGGIHGGMHGMGNRGPSMRPGSGGGQDPERPQRPRRPGGGGV